MNWIIELWRTVTPDAHLSAFVAVFVVIFTAVIAVVFKLDDTPPTSSGNNNVEFNDSSSNSGTIITGTVNHRDPIV